jgi:hypothetical protein
MAAGPCRAVPGPRRRKGRPQGVAQRRKYRTERERGRNGPAAVPALPGAPLPAGRPVPPRLALARGLLAERGHQLADLRLRVAAVAASVLNKGSLPSFAQREIVLGETCSRSATCAVRR